MKFIRWLLGRFILFLDFVTRPRLPVRSPEEQARIDETTKTWILYQFATCPFCVRVRRAIRRYGLNISQKDAQYDLHAKAELLAGGKSDQVPCLRMGDRWLYESADIVAYLEQNFGLKT